MFLGPIEQSKPWNTNGIEGVYKFLNKFWSLFFNGDSLEISDRQPSKEEFKILHTSIKKIKEDIDRLSLNTCISQLMITVNSLSKIKSNKREILEPLTIIISPFAPHICEELWSKLGNKESISFASYPYFNKDYLIENEYEYPIMINGKLRAKQLFSLDIHNSEIEKSILENENVKKWVKKSDIKKIIIVPNKIINIVS
jgi:leucyl-tRNA synthetase